MKTELVARRAAFCCALLLVLLSRPQYLCGAPVVGAYYYPWYGPFEGGLTMDDTLRKHLVPSQPPALGEYSSRDPAVIASHIDQSHRGNIDFWSVSWWGPQSAEDTTFQNYILANPRAAELKYAVHYESVGRLGNPHNPNFTNLVDDFRYLANNYFDNPNYLTVDGRPVVFMYLTQNYFNSQASHDEVANLRATMQSEFGVNPYIVGDDLGDGFFTDRAHLWDAVTGFDAYGMAFAANGSTSAGLASLAAQYDVARNAIAGDDLAFIPTASPGYNDNAVRDGNSAVPRYMTDSANSPEGEFFERLLNEVVVPRVDPKADNILMVNSFNEWFEDTQIEMSVVGPATSTDDSGTNLYSEGYTYEGYGGLYLDLLNAATVPEPSTVVLGSLALLGFLAVAVRRRRKQPVGQGLP